MKLSAKLIENNEMLKLKKKNEIIEYVIEETKDIDLQRLRLNISNVFFILAMTVFLINSIQDVLDKMEIFCAILQKMNVPEEQIEEAKSIVEFLLANKMIKKTKMKKIVYHCIKNCFLERLGLN